MVFCWNESLFKSSQAIRQTLISNRNTIQGVIGRARSARLIWNYEHNYSHNLKIIQVWMGFQPMTRVWMGGYKCQLSVKILAICQLS